jgi:acetyl esterase
MPLDPQAQAFLDQMAAAGVPTIDELRVSDMRQLLVALGSSNTEPEKVDDVSNREIPGPAGAIPVRVYKPNATGPLPILVYFHGGGWVAGNLDTADAICRGLANAAECLVISVEYRLAPEHKFPAALDDCYVAVQWIAANAAQFGGDSSRLAVGGDSVGGNLAAVVTQVARDRGGPPLLFQLLVYPVTDFSFDTVSYRENAEGYMLTRDVMIWFWNHYLPAQSDGDSPQASPLRSRDLRGLPPALVITAGFDPLRDEGEAYASRLRDAGVAVVVRRYDTMIHGFFGLPSIFEQGKAAIAEAGKSLRAAFNAHEKTLPSQTRTLMPSLETSPISEE